MHFQVWKKVLSKTTCLLTSVKSRSFITFFDIILHLSKVYRMNDANKDFASFSIICVCQFKLAIATFLERQIENDAKS